MAIAHDAEYNDWSASSTTVTVSHVCTGANLYLWTAAWIWNGTIANEGCTYNGTAMTQRKTHATDNSGEVQAYGLANPDTGTHDMVFTNDNSIQGFCCTSSYTGVDQTTPSPDTAVSESSTAASFSQSVSISVEDSWLVAAGRSPSKVPSASAGTYVRELNATSGDAGWILDSNGARSTGSESLDYTYTGSSASYWIVDSIAPAAAVATFTPKTIIF